MLSDHEIMQWSKYGELTLNLAVYLPWCLWSFVPRFGIRGICTKTTMANTSQFRKTGGHWFICCFFEFKEILFEIWWVPLLILLHSHIESALQRRNYTTLTQNFGTSRATRQQQSSFLHLSQIATGAIWHDKSAVIIYVQGSTSCTLGDHGALSHW